MESHPADAVFGRDFCEVALPTDTAELASLSGE
jgi:hypothetical protein